jgi:class 3 adenylate cyclase/tetratricopeptide (TPR) repeat protein
MICPQCQTENEASAKFCEECAAPLARTCGNCGRPLSPRARFCPECAHPTGLAPEGSRASRFPSPDNYTPKHLAERILNSKAALEGERKQVTVLFADLKGSLELLADRDPEEARKLLDPVLDRMMEAVHHYEGTVNQVMGDGIMALFGAPVAHEDHAVRACFAALRMQRRVALYADELQRAGGTPVQIRVGLHSGEVVVRAIGSDLRMDYTAVGQTTHLAARMEQMARPGSTLVTGETLILAEGYVQVRSLGAVPVKGLETHTSVYELTGPGPTRSRLQASVGRGPTRFVGRDREMEQLAQALERVAGGHGQAVAVVGEVGVGKSRLLWEFTRSHRTHGWLILESGAVSYGKSTPYLPVIELLKSYCQIQERDDPRVIRERVAGKLLMLDRALEPFLTPLLALLDVPAEDAVWDALDPPHRRQRTLDAVKCLLLRESQIQPLLLLFEDLHWIDSETQAVLDALLESLPTARVLLLVSYRPEYEHTWGRKTYYTQLRIDPLPPGSADVLLNALLGEARPLEPLKRVLIERTQGNPFYLEESVQSLVETGVLAGERGAFRLAKALQAWQIPATIQAVLAARIDRLPSGEKHLLQTASVIGKDVSFALLQAIADEPEDSLRQGLSRLQAAEFLYEASLFPDLEYTFKHALTHEVAYGSLLHERRRELHARIVAAIEQLYPDRLEEQTERLAHHALRGELWPQAVPYVRRAAQRAVGRNVFGQAAAYFEEGLQALAQLPASQEREELTVDFTLGLRYAVAPLGELDRMLTCSRRAMALAEALGDPGRLGLASNALMNALNLSGDAVEAVSQGERSLALVETSSDIALQISIRWTLAQALTSLGDFGRAITLLEQNMEALRGGGDTTYCLRPGGHALAGVQTRTWLAVCLAELGEFDRALRVAEEGARVGLALDTAINRLGVSHGLARPGILRGDYAAAIPVLESGLAITRDMHIPMWFPTFAGDLGYAYALSGRLPEGLALLAEALSVGQRTSRLGHGFRLSLLSETSVLAGRPGEAIAAAERGLEWSRARHERANETRNLHILAEATAQRDPPDLALADRLFREAAAEAEQLGMRPLVARCYLDLGRLARRMGQRQRGQEHLSTAAGMLRDMGMHLWLEQAEAEMKL